VPSVLDEFRAQLQAVEEVRVRLTEVAGLLKTLTVQAQTLSQDAALRQLVTAEQNWLAHAQGLVREVRQFRELETSRFWPATWRRWAMAMALVLATAFAAGAAYVRAARPYETELANLRERAAFGDAVASRVVHMSPDEKRRFDALMSWQQPTKGK
jgi:hypothetical protein